MKYEYLIFNIIVISGPLIFGSTKRFYFLNRIKEALVAVSVPLIPFLIWDSLVTGRHWFFNDNYILGIYFFGLPLEEILFFITVPLACIFTWEMLNRFTKGNKLKFSFEVYYLPVVLLPITIYMTILGKEYTALASAALVIAFLYDKILGTNIFLLNNTPFYLLLIIFFTIIFNGYLTWRPIVTYDEQYQLGFRIFTIPIEDFLFGLSLILISTSTYVKLTNGKNVFSIRK